MLERLCSILPGCCLKTKPGAVATADTQPLSEGVSDVDTSTASVFQIIAKPPTDEKSLLNAVSLFGKNVQDKVPLALALAQDKQKRFSGQFDDLSVVELAALWLYSQDGVACALNTGSGSEPFLAIMASITSKLPKTKQLLACFSKHKEVADEYDVGATFWWGGLHSLTRSIDGGPDVSVTFVCEVQAVDISKYMRFGNDGEWIIPPSTALEVCSKMQLNDSTWYIRVKQKQ